MTSPLLKMIALMVSCVYLVACGQLLAGKVTSDLPALKPGNYELDPHHTTVLFKIEHLGVSAFVGRFNRSEAALDYVDSDPAASSIVADVDMTSLDVNRPDFAETLMGCDWLCAEQFPKARFESSGRAEVAGKTLRFNGQLTFRGGTKPTQMVVLINGATTNRLTGDYTLGFEAHLQFLRSDFGMDAFIPAVGDEVSIEVFAEFIRQ